jgi:two-component system sensor histidine kinase AlgZ
MKLTPMSKRKDMRQGSGNHQVLPDFCQAGVFFIAVLGGELLALILAFAAVERASDFWTALALISLLVQWVVMGSSLAFCLLGRWLNRLEARKALGLAYVLIILVAGIMGFGSAQLAIPLGLYSSIAVTQPSWFYIKLLAIAGITAAILLRYLYVQQQWRAQVEAESLARIEALQARIRPHFLFNSLNTISSLVRGRPKDAESAIGSLSGLFRASLKAEPFCPLSEELALTRDYLALEALRLGERLHVVWDQDEAIDMSVRIPSLSVQPLVENAIYHGVEPRIEGGEVKIVLSQEEDSLRLKIVNPLPQQTSASSGNQMALDNIRQRLELAYGSRASLEMGEQGENFEVEMIVPEERAEQ